MGKSNPNINILMILQSDYPPDIRVSKEIKALKNKSASPNTLQQ